MCGLTLLAVETKAGMGSKAVDSTYSFAVEDREEHDPNLSPFLRKLFKQVSSKLHLYMVSISTKMELKLNVLERDK